jgi:quercetin dioxygenase-like cupin family protein
MSDRPPTIDLSEGRPFDALGAPVRRLIHPNTVGSVGLGVSICDMPPGARVQLHRHSYEESYFVISGRGTMSLEGVGSIELRPDLLVYIAPGLVHGQVNDGDEPLRILCSLAPPPVEGEMPELLDDVRAT